MVEMTEVANILRNATSNSLIILDEIGRGTSTFDGLSIAWAVVEHIANTKILGAKTLFATHYHELTELEGTLDGVNNYCIAVKECGDDIVFLRKIIKGGADKSYGIQVAKLAGVPENVLNRAKELVVELSDADISQKAKDIAQYSKKVLQVSKLKRNQKLLIEEVGYDYEVAFDFTAKSADKGSVLFKSSNAILYQSSPKSGKLAFWSDGYLNEFDYMFPIGQRVQIVIKGDHTSTSLYIDGKLHQTLDKKILYKIGEEVVYYQSTLVFPLAFTGNFSGQLLNLKVLQK